MRQAAQQFGLRAAAFETARPQPHLVTEDLRDPSLPIAIEHEQRPAFGPAHYRKPARDPGIDKPEPASPLRLVATGAGEIGGNRMALSDIGHARLEPAFDDAAERLGRQGFAQRRAVEREGARVTGTGGFQKRAA